MSSQETATPRTSRQEEREGGISAVAPPKGTLGSSAARLADALELGSRLSKEFSRLSVYASMHSDEDTRVSTYQGMEQEMRQLGAQIGADTPFVQPEIL